MVSLGLQRLRHRTLLVRQHPGLRDADSRWMATGSTPEPAMLQVRIVSRASPRTITRSPPSKSDDTEGISAYDASLALQHAAGLNYAHVAIAATAADVNRNGQITSMDAFYILQRAVRSDPAPLHRCRQGLGFLTSNPLLHRACCGPDGARLHRHLAWRRLRQLGASCTRDGPAGRRRGGHALARRCSGPGGRSRDRSAQSDPCPRATSTLPTSPSPTIQTW